MSDLLPANPIDPAAIHVRHGATILPVATLAQAKAIAVSGDTVIVGPGAYTIAATLAKDGVNWHFEAGATVTAPEGVSIFSDASGAMSFSVTGQGDFVATATSVGHVLFVSNAGSDIKFSCATAINDASTSVGTATILQQAGRVSVVGKTIRGAAGTVWWTNGEMFLVADLVQNTFQSALYLITEGTQTGQFYARIAHLKSDTGNPIELSGESTARAWVDAQLIETNTGIAVACIGDATGPYLYVTAHKILNAQAGTNNNQSVFSSGVLYLTTQKISTNVSTAEDRGAIYLFGGKSFIRFDQFDDTAGTNPKGAIYCTAGTHDVGFLSLDTTQAGDAVTVDGGTLTLHPGRMTTASGFDLVQTGGTFNVVGGSGSESGGAFATSGTVTQLNQSPPTTNASALTSGTLADARLSNNVVLESDTAVALGGTLSTQGRITVNSNAEIVANAWLGNYLIQSANIWELGLNLPGLWLRGDQKIAWSNTTGAYYDGKTVGLSKSATNTLKVDDGAGGIGHLLVTGTVKPGSYTVATLPTPGTAGRTAFATDGRKAGEGSGSGTGVFVTDDGSKWFACDTGALVAA